MPRCANALPGCRYISHADFCEGRCRAGGNPARTKTPLRDGQGATSHGSGSFASSACAGTAGGSSRWAWVGCEDCRAINDALGRAWGLRPLALGRHSLMNGIGVRGGAPPEVQHRQAARLAAFARDVERLRSWGRQEYRRLAADFDPLADIPLTEWQRHWPSDRRASADAFSRLLGGELPLRLPH